VQGKGNLDWTQASLLLVSPRSDFQADDKMDVPEALERNVFVGLEEDAMQDEVDVSAWQELDLYLTRL
jgi:hypothetical protein